jgi:uncharacterized protein (TIGR01319 family)
MTRSEREEGAYLLADLGSTFTKVVCVDHAGNVVSASASLTDRENLDRGYDLAREKVLGAQPLCVDSLTTLTCSSAAGGLRLFVVGLEAELTVTFGRLAAATAGGRVVGSMTASAFATLTPAEFAALSPDILVLTGGTDGGDQSALLLGARASRQLEAACPVVVAGNQSAYPAVRRELEGVLAVQYVANVMPRLNQVVLEPARQAIRAAFVDHVIGTGRFASASVLAESVVMPTPSAVLLGTEALAALGEQVPRLRAPVVVDVGGATTDVHSVMPEPLSGAAGPTEGAHSVRTVEADLGLREGAPSLLESARQAGWITKRSHDLTDAADHRSEHRDYLPASAVDRGVDRRLATLAAGMSIARHAGKLQFEPGSDGFAVRATGRDLRSASCMIASGGIFGAAPHPERILRTALRVARSRGALVPAQDPSLIVDGSYLLWAAGLLSLAAPNAARALLVKEFGCDGGVLDGS